MTAKATRATMDTMFAPYCPTCDSRRLLGLSRIVASAWEDGGPIHVRCTCGTVVDADARPPDRSSLHAA